MAARKKKPIGDTAKDRLLKKIAKMLEGHVARVHELDEEISGQKKQANQFRLEAIRYSDRLDQIRAIVGGAMVDSYPRREEEPLVQVVALLKQTGDSLSGKVAVYEALSAQNERIKLEIKPGPVCPSCSRSGVYHD